MKSLLLLFVVLGFSILPKHSLAQTPSTEEALLRVGNETVTIGEFLYLYRKNHIGGPADYTPEKVNEYLELFTTFKLKVLEAKRKGDDTTKAFQREFQQYRDELRKPYLPDKKLSDSLLQLTYERMKEEVRASHILIGIANPGDTLTPYKKLLQIRQEILAGLDFNEAARRYSEDPTAKENLGDLGYFTALQMVFPFENAAYSTPVGKVSMPVRTRFGYHLVKVTGRQPSRGEVEVAHILIRYGQMRSDEMARKLIFEIGEKLNGGMKWEEVCAEYSEDPGSKDVGGKLKPFGTGVMNGLPEFERTAFELRPGEISDPFKTQLGWHILRVERRIPLAPLDQVSASLRSKVNRDDRSQVARTQARERLRIKFHYVPNDSLRNEVYRRADSTLTAGKWRPGFAATLLQSPLFTIDSKPLRVTDFLSYIHYHHKPGNLKPVAYLEQLYQQFVDEAVMQAMETEISASHPEFSFLLREYYEGILLFGIMEREVWSRASADSAGQMAYFLKNRKAYPGQLRAEAVIYSAPNPEVLTQLSKWLPDGSADSLRMAIRKGKIKSETGFFEPNSRPYFQAIPWNPGVHLTENNGMYYLAWLKRILPAGPKEFVEVRPQVVSDYQNFLEKKWVATLRKKTKVTINPKARKYCLEQLVKK